MTELVTLRIRAFQIVCAGVAVMLALASPARADRPGTPNNESAHVCGSKTKSPPAVCVSFFNTATEPVRFDVDVTVNGAAMGAKRLSAECMNDEPLKKRNGCIDCGPIGGFHRSLYYCTAVENYKFGSRSPTAQGRTGVDTDGTHGVLPQGMKLTNLDYNTTYCLRFKARRDSDDMVSARWSNWACATTGDPPGPIAKPLAPTGVSADFQRVGAESSRVIIKWRIDQDHYSNQVHVYKKYYDEDDSEFVEVENEDRNAAQNSLVDIMTKAEIRTGGGRSPSIKYRVCLENEGGKACSKQVSSFTPGKDIDKAPPGDVVSHEPPVAIDPGPADVVKKAPPVFQRRPHRGVVTKPKDEVTVN